MSHPGPAPPQKVPPDPHISCYGMHPPPAAGLFRGVRPLRAWALARPRWMALLVRRKRAAILAVKG